MGEGGEESDVWEGEGGQHGWTQPILPDMSHPEPSQHDQAHDWGVGEPRNIFHGWSSDSVIIPRDSSVIPPHTKAVFRAGCHELEQKTEFSPPGDKRPLQLGLHTSRHQQIESRKANIPFTCKCPHFLLHQPCCSPRSWMERAGPGGWGMKRRTDEFRQVGWGGMRLFVCRGRTQILTFIYCQSQASQLPPSRTTTNGH